MKDGPAVTDPFHDDRAFEFGFDESSLTITAIEARYLDVPTTRPHNLSNTSMTSRQVVLVRLILQDGTVGYGEGATLGGPRWAEESAESIQSCIACYLAPPLIGRPANRFEMIAGIMAKAATRNMAAKAAIEGALYDAVGRSLSLPAAQLLGGQVHDRFDVIWALASGDVEQEIEEAKGKLADRLHRRFKIKVGFSSPKEDMERLRRLRDALPGCDLIVDVNQAWSRAQCRRWIPALAELDIALVEQPVAAGDLEGLSDITQSTAIPIMVDEGAFSTTEVARAGCLGAGTILSLKLVKSGGLIEMKRAAGVAAAHGMELYGGCLLESGIGAAAHLAVFSTLPTLQWGTEHFGPSILLRDLTRDSVRYQDFHVLCPPGPGLGIDLDMSVVEDCAVSGWS